MSGVANFREYPDLRESDTAGDGPACDAEAGDWLCTRRAGHDAPHQAGGGFNGSYLYAQWEDEA